MSDIRRLVAARVGVRDIVAQGADRRRAWRRGWRLLPGKGGRVQAGDEPRGRRFDVALDSGDLAGEQQIGPAARLPRVEEHRRTVDVGVTVHHAEAHEFGLFEPWNHPQHTRLFPPFQLRLKADETEMLA